jgi:hypothetical protein
MISLNQQFLVILLTFIQRFRRAVLSAPVALWTIILRVSRAVVDETGCADLELDLTVYESDALKKVFSLQLAELGCVPFTQNDM